MGLAASLQHQDCREKRERKKDRKTKKEREGGREKREADSSSGTSLGTREGLGEQWHGRLLDVWLLVFFQWEYTDKDTWGPSYTVLSGLGLSNMLITWSGLERRQANDQAILTLIKPLSRGPLSPPLLRKENTRKIMESNTSIILQIKRKTAGIQGLLIQKKWLNLSKNNKLCDIWLRITKGSSMK